MSILRNLASAAALALAVAPAAALAQTQHFGDRTPSVQEIEQALSRPMESEPGAKTRGIGVGAAAKSTAAAPAAPAPAPSISMQILFDFDSDRIQPNSTASLNNLARALQSDALRMKTFEVIGHTDAAGSPGYNLNLSQRRAASVKSYLVDQGVDPSRLRTLGRGASQLYNPRQPYSGENRRVEVAVGG